MPACNNIPSRKKAGHRSWVARSAPVPGGNQGDIMSAAKRSALMARIRGSNTRPERLLADALRTAGLSFEQHPRGLPGRPDFVFRERMIAVFVDGDFWHGWRFPLWRHKLTPKWREKIEGNRRRDQRNFRKLRRMNWKVIRIWEHQIEQSVASCKTRIVALYRAGRK
ncbi:MAG: very short patch repair endonuclease [Pirellulales bacterium]